MKFFAAIVLIAAVATAQPISHSHPNAAAIISHLLEAIAALRPESVAVGPAIIDTEPISVGPALVDADYEPIAVGPAIVDGVYEPISVGPAIVDFPLPEPIVPSPVAVVEGPASNEIPTGTPLVQIILNINQAAAESSPIAVSPVDIAAPEIEPTPVQVVDSAPEPVQVVEVAPVPSPISPPIAVHPIGVVTPVRPEPVQIGIPIIPVPVEPVQIGVPVIPEAAVVLPEQLN